MALNQSLNVALKEWHSACRALESGRQILLLRKGGIHESSDGFELEHGQFLLFPTYVHQNLNMLKQDAHEGFESHATEPQRITLTGAAEVTDILRLKYREQMNALESEHIWTSPLIDMRFNYKPQNPLYLLLVRAFRLHEPIEIENTPDYAGCKSWVPLVRDISTNRATPAIEDAAYEKRRRRIVDILRE
jgi:hypothetical protein